MSNLGRYGTIHWQRYVPKPPNKALGDAIIRWIVTQDSVYYAERCRLLDERLARARSFGVPQDDKAVR